jgi:hypothetical protein
MPLQSRLELRVVPLGTDASEEREPDLLPNPLGTCDNVSILTRKPARNAFRVSMNGIGQSTDHDGGSLDERPTGVY